MSPLTQGLNYRSACDTAQKVESRRSCHYVLMIYCTKTTKTMLNLILQTLFATPTVLDNPVTHSPYSIHQVVMPPAVQHTSTATTLNDNNNNNYNNNNNKWV